MQEAIFVLVMLWGGESEGGIGVVMQEFNGFENCEIVRKSLEQAHIKGYNMRLRVQGCFKK
jgi:hypothetical protein